MRKLLPVLLFASAACAQMRVLTLPSKSPIVTIRMVFTAGSAVDPPDKPGVASLTAAMLAYGGTRELTYQQVLDAMFPMAASLETQVDKEMTTFSGDIHIDNLDAYYKLIRAMLLDPGWREEDFKRVKDDALNYLRVTLRGNNDEELAKEVLYNAIFAGTPYGHENTGTVSSLEKITLDDLKTFYHHNYTQANLILGISGAYPTKFLETLKADLRKALPKAGTFANRGKLPSEIDHNRAVIIEKETPSVAISLGFPLHVKRGDPEYPSLLVVQSWLGQHRMGGRLFDRMRELRGLNYGDYAYIEYFPQGMYRFEPSPNLARKHQIFQIWIRPVEPQNAVFALRLAEYELDKLIRNGLSEEDFERTRAFVSKYVNVLTKTKRAELGYRIDSLFYDTPNYTTYVKDALAKLTREQVNRVIKHRLRAERIQIVAVAKDAAGLKQQLTSGAPSPITYNSPKPKEITDEDKVVERWDLKLRPQDVTVVPADQVFE